MKSADKRKSIFIVDKAREAHRLSEELNARSYSVQLYEQTSPAFQACRKHQPLLVILEIHSPIQDGYRFFRQLKTNYFTKDISVFVTTHEPDINDRINAIQMGIDDYIPKPYIPEEVVVRVDNFVQDLNQMNYIEDENSNDFSGNLSEMSLLDILKTLELGEKSALIHLSRGVKEGCVYIKNGELSSVELQDESNLERALFHMLSWKEGHFRVDLCKAESIIEASHDYGFLHQSLKLIEKWQSLKGDIPSLDATFVATNENANESLSWREHQLLHYFSTPRSVYQAINSSEIDDFDILVSIQSLLRKKVLAPFSPQTANLTDQQRLLRYYMKRKSLNSNTFSRYASTFRTMKNSSMSRERFTDPSSLYSSQNRMNESTHHVSLSRAELLLIHQKLNHGGTFNSN